MQNKMAVTITWFSVEPVQHLKWFMLVMCILAAYGDNPCEENIYLEVGTEGVVSCDFRDFVLLGWINGDENHEEASPFVYLESSQVKGRGYIDGNYDMQPDGSLIIKNVQLRNEANYTALYVPSFGPQVYFKVPVRVFVRPDPEYPVINGLNEQQYIVQDVMSSGAIECTLNGSRPGVPLEWVYQSDIITMDNELSSITPYNDDTFNTVLRSPFTIIRQSVTRVTVKCRTAGEYADLFPLATTIYLQLTRNYPIVNGLVNQPHGVVEMNRNDELSCFMNRVPQDTLLQWVLPTEEPSGELMLQNETSTVNNEDGTANITLTSRFSVLSPSIRRVTLQCRVSGQQAERYPDFTVVDVLISESFPVVNGHNGEEHVVLHLKREDELTCSTNRVSQDVSLEWVIINPDVAEKIHLEDEHSKTRNEDGTFNILLRSQFSVLSHTLQHVTMECRVVGLSADQFKEVTTIEVLITQKSNTGPLPRPVIDGCYSQQEDCTLIVQQDGTLTCYVPNIPSEYTMNMSLDIFGDAGGIYFTRIKSYRHTHMCGDYDLTTSYQYTINEASTCAMSAIRCSLSGMDTSTLLTSSTASLIAFQDTMCSSEAIHEHRSVSNQMLVIYIILSLIVIELLFVTYTITRKIHQMQRQLVKLPSLLNGESQEEIVLQTELSSRNHSPNQTQINVMVSTDSLTPQLNTPLLERQNLGKESVRHSSDESGITSGTGSDTSKS